MGFFKKLGTMISGKDDAVKPKVEKVDLKDLGIEIEVSFNDDIQIGENKIIAIPSVYHEQFEEIPGVMEKFAKTLFLNSLPELCPIKEPDKYHTYLKWVAKIDDPTGYHAKMVEEGYLEKPEYRKILNSKKVTELKEILGELNLAKSGTKGALINRIIENTSEEESMKIIENFNGYVLSGKGLNFIRENYDYVQLHDLNLIKIEISVNEYGYNKSKLNDDSKFEDVISYTLREHIEKSSPNVDPLYFEFAHYDFAKFSEKTRNYAESILSYMVALYISTSGIKSKDSIVFYKSKAKHSKFDVESIELAARTTYLFAGAADGIKDLKDYYKDEMVDEIFESIKLPVNILTKDDFKVILNEIMLNRDYDEDKINKILYDKFMEYIYKLPGGYR